MNKKYYSTIEAAKILRVSRVAVLKSIKSGRMPAERVGKNYIISHQDLMEALGKSIGPGSKENIDKALNKALKDYGETFKLLGRK